MGKISDGSNAVVPLCAAIIGIPAIAAPIVFYLTNRDPFVLGALLFLVLFWAPIALILLFALGRSAEGWPRKLCFLLITLNVIVFLLTLIPYIYGSINANDTKDLGPPDRLAPKEQSKSSHQSDPGVDKIVGVYLQRGVQNPASRFRFEIHANGRWAMGNALSAWWGKWEVNKGKYSFVGTDGPTGRFKHISKHVLELDEKGAVKIGGLYFDKLPKSTPYIIPLQSTSLGTEKIEH